MEGKEVAVALVGVLLFASGTAMADSSSFPATNIQWEGPANLQLAGAVLDLRLPAEPKTAAFTLQAGHVRLEVDTQTKIRAQPAVSAATAPAEPSTEEYVDWASTWLANESAGFFLQADAASKLSAASGRGTVDVPSKPCLKEPTYFTTGRPENCPSLSQAIRVTTDSSQWSLAGNFTLALWQWATEDDRHWSGSRPANAALDFGQYEFRMIHLVVTNGQLEFKAQKSVLDGYAEATALASDAPTAVSIAGHDTRGIGGSKLDIVRSPAGVSAQVQRAPSPNHGPSSWWWTLSGLALLAVAPAILAARRHSASSHLMHASRNMLLGNHHAAFSHAFDAYRHSAYRQEAGLLAAIALIRTDEHERAEAFIDRLAATHTRTSVAYLLANLRMRQSRPDEARLLLDECARLDPQFKAEIAANPLFSPLEGAGVGYQ